MGGVAFWALLASLAGLEKLEWIHLGSNNLTDAAIEPLSKLKSLKTLILTFNRFSPEGREQLQQALPNAQITF